MRVSMIIIPAILFTLLSPVNTFADADKDLINAAEKGDIGKVREALEKGADVNASTFWGGAPIANAAEKGHLEVVKLLLETGKVSQKLLNTALFKAVYYDRLEITRLLLDKGADANVDCGPFGSPLAIAARNGRSEITEALLEKGADPQRAVVILDTSDDERRTGRKRFTPAELAQLHGNDRVVRIIEAALKGQATAASPGSQSETGGSQPETEGKVNVKGEMNSCVESVQKELQSNPATRNTPIKVFVSCENGYVTLQINCNAWANNEANAQLKKRENKGTSKRAKEGDWGAFLELSQPENNFYGQLLMQQEACNKHLNKITETAKHANGVKDVNVVDR